MARLGWLMAAALLAGCAAGLPDVAVMPTTPYGTPALSDRGAVELIGYTLTDPAVTAGNPVLGAQSLAAVDYLAGEFDTPRWIGLPVGAKLQMIQARGEIRILLGILPGTASQEVVNRLIGTSVAFAAGDRTEALRALTAPAFSLGPEATAAILANLPYLQLANAAAQSTLRAENQQGYRGCRILTCF